jgi:hypothetical protein
MSVLAGSARTLRFIDHSFLQVKNTFISVESLPSPLSVQRAKVRAKTWSFDIEASLLSPDQARANTWSFGLERESIDSRSSPSGASSGLSDEGAPAEERGDRTPVSFCSTPSPRAPAGQLSFIRPPAPPPAPAQAVLVQALLLPAVWPLAAPTSTPPGPLVGPCVVKSSSPPPELGARQSRVGRRLRRPPSMPTVPLQSRQCSTVDGYVRIQWTVDARKLKSSDKQLVSPPLDVDLGLASGPVAFKIMLTARGVAFKKSGGVGCVQVKCCSELGEDACTKVRIAIGRDQPRGPVPHCFSSNPVFSLPKELAEWDFHAAAERQSNSMVVNVDIAPPV